MLTLKSKFADYIGVLKAAGACEEVMSFHDKMLKEKPDLLVGDVYAVFQKDDTFEDAWCMWAFKLIGHELDSVLRRIIIDKIRQPYAALILYFDCLLSADEKTALRDKFDGVEEVAKAVVCVDAILKSREFNAVRAEAVATCKSITEAKTLIEASVVATSITASADTKSSSEIKSVLETERTKMTEALKQVMKEQGFVDGNGDGSVSVFDEWLHKVV